MKKFKLLLSSFFILALGINGNSNEKKHEELRCHFETNFTYESFYGIPSSQVVYVCIGPYAYAYHSRSDCPGLGNCKGEIRYTDQYTAENKLGRVPCCRCWPNVAGRCKDDNPYYSPPIQFNPYVPQIPSVAYDPDYIAARNQREQEQAEAIATLVVLAVQGIASLISPTPEGIARREARREIRHDKQKSREINKIIRQNTKYIKKTNKYRVSHHDPQTTYLDNNSKPEYVPNDNSGKYLFTTVFNDPPFEIPLRIAPKVTSREIYKCPKNALVNVIEISDDIYCKVNVNGHVGYITKSFLYNGPRY